MEFRIDSELCSGHGRCYTLAPSIYTADDEGFSSPSDVNVTVPADQEDAARKGKRSCPEGAISLIE